MDRNSEFGIGRSEQVQTNSTVLHVNRLACKYLCSLQFLGDMLFTNHVCSTTCSLIDVWCIPKLICSCCTFGFSSTLPAECRYRDITNQSFTQTRCLTFISSEQPVDVNSKRNKDDYKMRSIRIDGILF